MSVYIQPLRNKGSTRIDPISESYQQTQQTQTQDLSACKTGL